MEKLNQRELDIIFRLLDSKIDKLVEAITEWTDFGSEPPQYLIDSFAEHNYVRNKIVRMMK